MEQKRQTARAIIIQDEKILVFERWRRDSSGENLHYYSIPGGGIEAGETPELAVKRELMEEMGVVIAIDKLLFRQTTKTRQQYYFACTITSGTPIFQSDSPEALSLKDNNTYLATWVSLDKFKSLTPNPDHLQAVGTVILLRDFPNIKPPIDIVI